MTLPALRPRALIAAGPERQTVYAALFVHQSLAGWDTLPAQSFGQARFLLQHQPCDIVLVSGDLAQREGSHGLALLTGQRQAPLIFLGDDGAADYAHAYDAGAATCLPRSLILAHPPLLQRAMRQALQTQKAIDRHAQTLERLADSRRHVDRLTQIIWRMTPRHDDLWYPQRHMLERLDEEAARSRRHRVPLSVAVGELHSTEGGGAMLPDWAAEAIVRGKRRSDVVGQYGPGGFLMLMMHTPKPGGVTCCRRLQEALEHPAETGAPRAMRSYFGIATATADESAPQMLLRIAEENLEAARSLSESCVVAD
jgi:GGDEF domain-containing protein